MTKPVVILLISISFSHFQFALSLARGRIIPILQMGHPMNLLGAGSEFIGWSIPPGCLRRVRRLSRKTLYSASRTRLDAERTPAGGNHSKGRAESWSFAPKAPGRVRVVVAASFLTPPF